MSSRPRRGRHGDAAIAARPRGRRRDGARAVSPRRRAQHGEPVGAVHDERAAIERRAGRVRRAGQGVGLVASAKPPARLHKALRRGAFSRERHRDLPRIGRDRVAPAPGDPHGVDR